MVQKAKILYVDDDTDWQGIIRDGISSLSYQIDFASSSMYAINMLKKNTYHVALLDKRLAESDAENQDGLALAEVIAGINEGTNIIIYTSYGNNDDIRAAFRNIKVWDFIDKQKPIIEVINSIREAVENAEIEFNRPTRMPIDILPFSEKIVEIFSNSIAPNNQSYKISKPILDTFAKQILGQFRPLLRDKDDAKLLSVQNFPILQVRFWSKILGAPIAIWFGNYDNLMSIFDNGKTEVEEKFNIKRKVSELIKSSTMPNIGEIVLLLDNVEIDEFESQLRFDNK